MPTYDYRCRAHGAFEASAGRGEHTLPCPRCGAGAERQLSVPYLKGDTVVKSIPDPEYRHEAEVRANRKRGWDVDRAVREMRKGLREDKQGNRYIQPTASG